MAKRRVDYDVFVPALLTILSNKLATSSSVIYRRRFDLSTTECRVILLLAKQPSIPAQRVADVIGFDKGLVSRTVHQLSAKGILLPQDGSRRPLLALSPKGIEMCEHIAKVALRRESLLLTGFAKAEVATLISFLQRLAGNMQFVTDYCQREPPPDNGASSARPGSRKQERKGAD